MTNSNPPLPPVPAGATSTIVNSIRQASRGSDVDFGLLMAQAEQESGFNAHAHASGSSAAGLYQFIDSTWLDMVRRFGGHHGLGDLAQQITTDSAGRATVADPATRQHILALRNDPALSAAFAGEYTRLNGRALEQALGRPPCNADLYMAHFLGAGGAATFLKALNRDGGTVAADLMPNAAAANSAVFYDNKSGRPRTISEIYQSFAERIDGAARRLTSADPADEPGASDMTLPGAPLRPQLAEATTPFRGPGALMPAPGGPLENWLDIVALSALKLMARAAPTDHLPVRGHRSI
jgi:Transglycosylase SLT domain